MDVEPPPEDEKPAKTSRRKTKLADEERTDVVEICLYLADAIEAGGSKRPPIGKKWFTEARLLLDEKRDPKATVERVKALIDWIQTNDWWKPKVLAMPKLRNKYDEIRLDAVRDFNRNKAANADNGSGYTGRGSGSSNRKGYQPWQQSADQSAYDVPFADLLARGDRQ